MDFQQALKDAGINITEKVPKIERDKVTLKNKIDAAINASDLMLKYVSRYNASHDATDTILAMDGLTNRFNEIAQFLKDMGKTIYTINGGKPLKESQMTLGWSIRQLQAYLVFSVEQTKCLDDYKLRNEVEHEYFNSLANKEDIVDVLVYNHGGKYTKEIVLIIKQYFIENGKY